MKTIKIPQTITTYSEIEVPNYFKNGIDYCRLNNDGTFFTVRKHYGEDDYWLMAKHTFLDTTKPFEKISKGEFVAYCNKAFKSITGFKHVEELWEDEEADTHNTEEIDLLSQCEIFIAGVQSYLGDDSGKELLEKIKNYKK